MPSTDSFGFPGVAVPRVFATLLLFVELMGARVSAQTTAPGQEFFEKGMNALVGSGMSRSEVSALENLRQSANLGYAPAQVVLGSLYQTGQIVVREARQALDWYKKAADQGDPLAAWARREPDCFR